MINKDGKVFETPIFSDEIDYKRKFRFLCAKYNIDPQVILDKLLAEKEVKPICIVSIFKDGSFIVNGDQERFVGLEFSNPGLTKFLLKTE